MHLISPSSSALSGDRRRWLALGVVCLAQLMIVLDTTIVNVALPAIQHDLKFGQGTLTWVINAFLVTFGSFLLLAGRLGDLFGRKRVFISGVIVFTVASMLCGLAPNQAALIGARFLQGIGAAMQASVILAIIATEFPLPSERARAMSGYVFVAVAGGSLGLLAGGVLTQALSWHWIFFVNLPIGAMTIALGRVLIPADDGVTHGRVDWLGSLLVTAALMSVIYAIVQASAHGWGSSQVLGFGGLGAALLVAFVGVRGPHRQPDPAVSRPPHPGPDELEPRPRTPRDRHVLDVLPGHALPGARAPLRGAPDRSRVPALDTDGRRAVARHHGAAGRAIRRDARDGRRDAHGDRGSRPAHDGRCRHELLPDDLPRVLHDRARDRHGVHATSDDRDGQRPRGQMQASPPASSTFPSRSPERSGSPFWARSRPTAPTRSQPLITPWSGRCWRATTSRSRSGPCAWRSGSSLR